MAAGFACADCGHDGGWRLGDGRFRCSGCGGRSSVTAGTIFDRTRTPLTVWFNACWLFATGKDGISALSRSGRSRSAPTRPRGPCGCGRCGAPGPRPLADMVEVDETYIGGEEPELAGGRGKKVLTSRWRSGSERAWPCRLMRHRHPFVTDHVEPGATVFTDGWQGYHGLERLGYVHARRSQRAARARGEDTGELLPAVHRVASLAKRLLGTHQDRWSPPTGQLPISDVQPPTLSEPRDGLLPGSSGLEPCRTRKRPVRPGALTRRAFRAGAGQGYSAKRRSKSCSVS